MRTIAVITGVVAILLMACSIIIASMFTGDGMLTASTLAIITGLFGPTILSMLALLNANQAREQGERIETKADHIEEVVNGSHEYNQGRVKR